MKSYSLLTLALLSVVVLVSSGVGYAEAYDGNIDILDGKLNDLTIGDKIFINGIIGTGDLISNEKIIVTIYEKDNGDVVETSEITINPSTEYMFEDVDRVWPFSYETTLPLNKITANTIYMIKLQYDNVVEEENFYFMPTPAQQAITSGESFAKMEEMKSQPKEIPSWVKDIFGMYYLEQISDQELISALEYLIKVKIIVV